MDILKYYEKIQIPKHIIPLSLVFKIIYGFY